MRGRRFSVPWQEADTAEVLKAGYLAEHAGEIRSRLQALWLLRAGHSLAETTATLGVHYRTVQRWVGWYRRGGLALVRARRMGGTGQTPFLTGEQQAEVAHEVGSGRFRTAAEIRDWIAERYQARYTVGGVYTLLARLRCGPKVPRPINPKTDPTEQEAWKKGGSALPLAPSA